MLYLLGGQLQVAHNLVTIAVAQNHILFKMIYILFIALDITTFENMCHFISYILSQVILKSLTQAFTTILTGKLTLANHLPIRYVMIGIYRLTSHTSQLINDIILTLHHKHHRTDAIGTYTIKNKTPIATLTICF